MALNLVLTLDGEIGGMVSASSPNTNGDVELIWLWSHPPGEAEESATRPLGRS